MKIKGQACSVIGGREMNQDSFVVNDETLLYAVADGVGGGMRGEVASQMSTAGLKVKFSPGRELKPLFEELQISVLKEAMESIGEPIMGTTLTAIHFEGDKVKLCHVGDSRCYWLHGGVLKLMTEDQEFFDEGLQSTVLASYLGIPTDLHPLKIYEDSFTVQTGDSLILCSDGLYRQLTETRIVELIKQGSSDAEKLTETLCQEAARQQHSDNVTVVYISVE
jgi:serine/threonine protein phosphatase PrpC